MEKQAFEHLLVDLYKIYNPKKIDEVSKLVEKYNGQEYDAVQTFYFRYNFKSNANYDPKGGTDKHTKFLIEKYSSGERILYNGIESPINEFENKKAEIENKLKESNNKISEANSNIENLILGTREDIEKFFNEKMQQIDKYFEAKKSEITKQTIVSNEETSKVDIKLNLNYDDVDIQLPKSINEMNVGSRLIVYDSNGGIVGLEIKDILYDCISDKDKCCKEITIDRIGNN